MNPKNSSLFFACTVSQSLLAYDKKKDFRLFFESQTRRESWCLETINDDNMMAVGQSEGRVCFYEASRRKAKFRERHSLHAFGSSSVWKIKRLMLHKNNSAKRQVLAVGSWGKGMRLITADMKHRRLKADSQVFMAGKHVQDILELPDGKLFVAERFKCEYFVIDLELQTQMFMCKGHSWAIQVIPFPGFDMDEFPYILAKEDYCLSIVNAKDGEWYKLKNKVYEARPLN